MEEITSELEEYILEMHNGFRNEIASGRTKPYKKAIRMACLVSELSFKKFLAKLLAIVNKLNDVFKFDQQEWDDDLAKLAAKHLKKCDFDIVKSPGTSE